MTIKDIMAVFEDPFKKQQAKLIFGDENIVCENFSKDTRTINEGDVYIGIKGDNFNGSDLYESALEKGAKVCILEDVTINEDVKEKYKDRAIIIVEDSIKALQQIAKYKRDTYKIPVVAITGSVGKTSTKDIIASVVSTKFKTLKTQGNLNNHIGLPLTILGLKDHEALVVEMGMSHFNEISVLSKIASPDIAVITNVGTAHIGNLGSRENILKAKLEIIEGLKPEGALIINNDNDMLNAWQENENSGNKIANVITFGVDNESQIMAKDVVLDTNSSTFTAVTSNGEDKIYVPVAGLHFVHNALAAICVGLKLGIPMEKIKEGIKNFQLTKSRMELIKLKDDISMVNDCYNANYDSMKAAIEYLGKFNNQRKIAVLGDMLELGEYSNELHTKVGEEVAKNNIDILIAVGEMGNVIAETASSLNSNVEVHHFNNNEQAIEKLKQLVKPNDFIVVKASNGMKFKEIIQAMEESFGE